MVSKGEVSNDFRKQVLGYGLTTAEIVYRRPDRHWLLQTKVTSLDRVACASKAPVEWLAGSSQCENQPCWVKRTVCLHTSVHPSLMFPWKIEPFRKVTPWTRIFCAN
jgi:hypothetical protein